MFAWEEGYRSGLINETANPYPLWRPIESLMWNLGNEIGRAMHCQMVEAIYLRFECGETVYA
jgi:hypothetical protein